MANTLGSEGLVKIGAATVAEVNGWSIDESASVIDDSNLSDTVTTNKAGRTSWTASIECFWDKTDSTGQEAMTIGATVTLNLYPQGAATGDQFATGSAIITSIGMGGATDSLVTRSFSLQGSGALAWAAV